MDASEKIYLSLGRLESSMDHCRQDIQDLKAETVGRLDAHGRRLGSLETDRTFVRRVGAAMIAGVAIAAGYFGLR